MQRHLEIDRTAFSNAFGREPLALGHGLRSHKLFSVEALAQLAERLAEDLVEHNVGDLPTIVSNGDVQSVDLPPGDIARGIETNGCWMVLKNVERDPAYRRLLDERLDQVSELIGSREGGMAQREGFIFLSAPGSVTPSHTDPEHNLLLQIRGTKDMSVGTFPDPETRQIVLETRGHRNVDWEPVDARHFPLAPGDGVYMPVHVPHWVRNGETVSVSFSITFRTPASERIADVHSFNRRLRKLKLSPLAPGEHTATDKAKALAIASASRLRRRVS